jgi:hypothetical protein
MSNELFSRKIFQKALISIRVLNYCGKMARLSKISTSIALMLLLASIFLSRVVIASSTVVYVYPGNYKASSVGEILTIQVKIDNVINLTSYKFKLRYNTTMLNCLNTSVGSLLPPPPKSNYNVSIDNIQGVVSAEASLQPGETPASGSGSLLRIEFNATYGTPYPQQETSTLEIFDDYLYGIGTPPQIISHETLNGTYTAPYSSPSLTLTLKTSREDCFFDEKIIVNGSLLGNGYPIPDALVALEVDNPYGGVVAARTFSTSALPILCPIQITHLIPCESDGKPKNNFQVKTVAYFNLTLINNSEHELNVTMVVNPYDSSNASLGVAMKTRSIAAGSSKSEIFAIPIENTANSGNATVYANVFSDLIRNLGIPLATEKKAAFTISGSPQGTPTYLAPCPQGSYETILNIHYKPYNAGNYTIYVAAEYLGVRTLKNKQIRVTIAGDFNLDGKVGLDDLVAFAKAYGSKPGEPNWSEKYDLDRGGSVDLADLVILAKNYGKGTET